MPSRLVSAPFFQMLQDGRFAVAGPERRSLAPGGCAAAYSPIPTRRAETTGVVVDRTRAA